MQNKLSAAPRAKADISALVRRLRSLVSYPISTEIDPKGWAWYVAPDAPEVIMETIDALSSRSAEAGKPVVKDGHEDHVYERFQSLFDRGRAAGGFEGETQNLIRELTNALRDAANWRAETKIALQLEQQMRLEAQARLSALSTPADSEPVAWRYVYDDVDGARHRGCSLEKPTHHDGYPVLHLDALYAAPVADKPVSVPEDDQALCELAEKFGAKIAWANEPDEFHHLIEFTPPKLRAMLAAAPQPNPSAVDASAVIERLTKALNLAADRLDASSHRVGDHDSRAAFGIAQWAIDARTALAAQGEKP